MSECWKNFIPVKLNLAGQIWNVSFFPDIPAVCFEDTQIIINEIEMPCGFIINQEQLIETCIIKINEGKEKR